MDNRRRIWYLYHEWHKSNQKSIVGGLLENLCSINNIVLIELACGFGVDFWWIVA